MLKPCWCHVWHSLVWGLAMDITIPILSQFGLSKVHLHRLYQVSLKLFGFENYRVNQNPLQVQSNQNLGLSSDNLCHRLVGSGLGLILNLMTAQFRLSRSIQFLHHNHNSNSQVLTIKTTNCPKEAFVIVSVIQRLPL